MEYMDDCPREDEDQETGETNNVRVVTLCELGRLVLMEYIKPEFWYKFAADVLKAKL